MKRKKLSAKNQLAVAAYEAAAKRIGRGKNFYACNALDDTTANLEHWERVRAAFPVWFRPRRYLGAAGWWPDYTWYILGFPSFQETTMRILALLLMAELVRAGQIDFDAP